MPASKMFYVYGCYGTLSVEIGTGNVLHYEYENPEDPAYEDISRIDIPTYEMTSGSKINPGDHVCIMDLNFWSHCEQYFMLDPYEVLDDEVVRDDDEVERDCPESVIVQIASRRK